MTIIDTNNLKDNMGDTKIFLGTYSGLQRFDVYQYKFAKNIESKMRNAFWNPEEISLVSDRIKFPDLPEHAQEILTQNLLFQTLMDSGQARGLDNVLCPMTTSPEWEAVFRTQAYFEHIHCIPADEEILTSDGWVKLSDVTYEHKVANWYADNNITFETPINIEKQHYIGDMINFSFDNYDLTVTPKHRMVGIKKWYDGSVYVDEAKDFKLSGVAIPINGYKSSGIDELTDLDRFGIAYQADGSVSNSDEYDTEHKTKRGYPYRFGFSKEREIERMLSLISDIGLEHTISIKDDMTHIYVWCDVLFDKEFDWINLSDISYKYGKQFIEELRHWDGCDHDSNIKAVRYINTNKSAIDKVAAIATISGYQVGTDDMITERNAKLKGYQLYITPKEYKTGGTMKKKTISWEGDIVGVEVPSTFIIVRTAGKHITVTGNSLTYSHIIREVYPNATKVFDSIQDYPDIQHRIDSEVAAYNALFSDGYKLLSDDKKREAILEILVKVFALEGVKFYVSFLTTYMINNSYGNKIQGITRLIKLINFDEDMHVSVFGGLLNILRKTDREGFVDLMKSPHYDTMVEDIFSDVAKSEINWGKYLLSIGNIPGLTPKVLSNFVNYYVADRMSKLKFEVDSIKADDTIEWFKTYKSIDLDQVAGQESEGLAYQVGIIKNDIPEGKFKL